MYIGLGENNVVVGVSHLETAECNVFVAELPPNVFKCVYENGVFREVPKCYCELRAEEYPELKDQLDMLYWDKINGTDNWVQAITAIKQKYSKEEYPQVVADCC